jgi:Flp pilus assembly pilin Flp
MERQHSSWYAAIDDALRRLVARVHTWRLLDNEGQGLVEYSLLLALIALVVIGIVAVMGQTVSGLWYQRILDRWPTS